MPTERPLILVLICISLMKIDLEYHLNVTATAFLMLSVFEGRKSVSWKIFLDQLSKGPGIEFLRIRLLCHFLSGCHFLTGCLLSQN